MRHKSVNKILILIVACLLFSPIAVFIETKLSAVTGSYNWLRPKTVSDGGTVCLDELKKLSVFYVALGDQPNGNCSIRNAVRITKFRETNIS